MTTLILTPTELEMRVLRPLLSRTIGDMRGHLELCGFGVVAAAARSMQLIARHQPENVILVGIAGSYRSELPVGCARNFLDVACVGIGVGTGSNHQSAGEIGWEHWTSERSTESGTQHAIGDILPLSNQVSSRLEQSGRLLTVCAAAANDKDVELRLAKHPEAAAEDMEGFGVAMSCALVGIPLQIIRGISNRAGDRDKRNWNIDGALHAAATLVTQM